MDTIFKKIVREKLGVNRVTLAMQNKVWASLSQKNKNKYGGWNPGANTVTLKPSNVCILGEGVYGKVCIRETLGGTKYAVKTPKNTKDLKNILRERATHMKFYYALPKQLRQYFPKPVFIKGESRSYAMTMFDGIELSEALEKPKSVEYKKNVLRSLRKAVFSLWTSGYIHGDLHMSNILVSRDKINPNIHIIDFGMMRKSSFNVPNKKFKIEGNVNYKNLNEKWINWFRKSWINQLKNLGFQKGNPNMIVFPRKLGNIGYYAMQHSGKKFLNLNKPLPSVRLQAKKPLEMYKNLVKKRTGVKRVTKQAQIDLWKKLSIKNKEQFGNWRPEGVKNSKVPTPKPNMNQYIMNAFMNEPSRADTLLRFWMTHYTQDQKRQIYNKVSDPEKAQRDFPLCK